MKESNLNESHISADLTMSSDAHSKIPNPSCAGSRTYISSDEKKEVAFSYEKKEVAFELRYQNCYIKIKDSPRSISQAEVVHGEIYEFSNDYNDEFNYFVKSKSRIFKLKR